MENKPTYEELELKVDDLKIQLAELKNIQKQNFKIAEQELIDKNKTLKDVQRFARIGSWVYDLVTGALSWTEEMFQIFGLKPQTEPPPYKDNKKLIHPDDWGFFDTAVSKCLSDGTGYDLELRINYPGGETRYIDARGYAEKDGDGVVKKIIGTTQDITERKKAEEALLKSEERYRTLFDNTSINTIVVDEKGKVTAFKFPEDTEEIVKPEIGDVMYVDYANYDQIDMYNELMDSIRSGNKKEFLDLKYGDKFLHIRISPYQDGAIITAIDTTRVRKLESELQQVKKMEGIGTLAGGIAHDFNNILSPILLHSEMIMEDLPPGDPLLHDIKQIYNAGERAKGLVQQILIYARKRPESRIILKSSHIINESVKFLRSTIPTTVDIRFDNKAEHDTVLADPTQLNQIVMNLCTNAAYAMREKGGSLEILLGNEEVPVYSAERPKNLQPGQYLKLTVKDSGAGITPEIKDKIFEPYFTTKGVGEGAGFGLATAHSIVHGYGGEIIFDSEIGKGSTFVVYLPLVKTEAQDPKEDNTEIKFGNEHILFVDDEEPIVRITQKSLKRYGYKVTGRTSSIEALEAFRCNPDKFDLLITDMTMPNMTGEDLAREFRDIKPEIPVILCTGFSDKIDEEKAKKIGISSFVMKPTIISELANTIRDVLDQK